MDSVLNDFKNLRNVLTCASVHASYWNLIWASNVSKIVRKIKNENLEHFKELMSYCVVDDKSMLDWLCLGNTCGLKAMLKSQLDFSNVGRSVASLAFAAYIIDVWYDASEFSWDFVLDSVALPIWQMNKFRLNSFNTEKKIDKNK